MDSWIAGWLRLPKPWKVALFVALAWLPVGAFIILSTSAAGEPFPMPWRLARSLVTYAAYAVIIATVVKLYRLRR